MRSSLHKQAEIGALKNVALKIIARRCIALTTATLKSATLKSVAPTSAALKNGDRTIEEGETASRRWSQGIESSFQKARPICSTI